MNSRWVQCGLRLAPGYDAEIRIEQLYLQEAQMNYISAIADGMLIGVTLLICDESPLKFVKIL